MKFLPAFIFFYFITSAASAQPDRANLDFEDVNLRTGSFNSWYRTFITPSLYSVELDSNTHQNGRYSLRITYAPGIKSVSNGQIANLVPLDAIGKTIRISAFAKLEHADDSAWLNFSINQDKEMRRKKVRTLVVTNQTEWKQYSWEISLDSFLLPAYNIGFYCYLKTRGSLWLDAFRIEVDGQDIRSMRPLSSTDNESVAPLTATQAMNLELLCRVWGFLKYFHPAVASGNYNWDMQLFHMIPVAKSSDLRSFQLALAKWIDSLGTLPACKKCFTEIPDSLVTYNLDQAWINDDSIAGIELKEKLHDVIGHRHLGESAYVKYDRAFNLVFENENEFNWRGKNFPNENFRLQFLFRYWNTIEYFSPYKNLIGTDWGQLLHEYLPRFVGAHDSMEYQLTVNRFVNSVNDSHTGSYNQVIMDEYAKLFVPATFKVIDDKAVVHKLLNDSLARLNDLRIGDVIESVDGRTIRQIIDERKDWVNGSNYPVKLRSLAALNLLTGGRDSLVKVEISRGSKRIRSTIHRYAASLMDFAAQYDTSTRWKIIGANIGYVNMGNIEVANVDSMMGMLKNTAAIIFDVRNYPRGSAPLICTYLVEKETEFAKTLYPNLNYPGTFLWSASNSRIDPRANKRNRFHYTGKVIILVNETTQSHAEWSVMQLQATPGAITIGSQTSGADGNSSKLYLTGNYFTYLTGLGVFYPDGTGTQRSGVRIDRLINQTAKGIREERDEVLEAAMNAAMK